MSLNKPRNWSTLAPTILNGLLLLIVMLSLVFSPSRVAVSTVHKVLTDAAVFKIEGNTLTLTNNDNLLVLTR